MTCPVCGGKTIVSGCKADCESVQRERRCMECGHIFYTEESVVQDPYKYKELYNQYSRERYKKEVYKKYYGERQKHDKDRKN